MVGLLIFNIKFDQEMDQNMKEIIKPPQREFGTTASLKSRLSPAVSNSRKEEKKEDEDDESSSEEVTRKTKIFRGADYIDTIFYAGKKKIATQRSTKDGILEQSGTIPDGKVTFTDEEKKLH